MALPAETEFVEFKEARNNFHFDDLGKYFSALSNEANLKGQTCGWLVFGVQDRPREIVGSNYRAHRPALDRLKQEVAAHTTNRITFDEIYDWSARICESATIDYLDPDAIRFTRERSDYACRFGAVR